MNLKSLANIYFERLKEIYDSSEAESIFLLAIKHFLGLGRADFMLKKNEELADENIKVLTNVLNQLETGMPIQYIIGETDFYGLVFKVRQGVLIPRPETEELVEWILSSVKNQFDSEENPFILDVGTGSGCIAISLKVNLPSFQVEALDFSEISIETANQNAVRNGVDINLIQDDIFSPKNVFKSKYSIIVSNPPYIKVDEKAEMHQNVMDFEPHEALFVNNENPLIFYEAIGNFAKQNLIPSGWLFFEINENLGRETVNLLEKIGFIDIELKKDMQGKDRMIRCRNYHN